MGRDITSQQAHVLISNTASLLHSDTWHAPTHLHVPTHTLCVTHTTALHTTRLLHSDEAWLRSTTWVGRRIGWCAMCSCATKPHPHVQHTPLPARPPYAHHNPNRPKPVPHAVPPPLPPMQTVVAPHVKKKHRAQLGCIPLDSPWALDQPAPQQNPHYHAYQVENNPNIQALAATDSHCSSTPGAACTATAMPHAGT
jgi:hypothetical protein